MCCRHEMRFRRVGREVVCAFYAFGFFLSWQLEKKNYSLIDSLSRSGIIISPFGSVTSADSAAFPRVHWHLSNCGRDGGWTVYFPGGRKTLLHSSSLLPLKVSRAALRIFSICCGGRLSPHHSIVLQADIGRSFSVLFKWRCGSINSL